MRKFRSLFFVQIVSFDAVADSPLIHSQLPGGLALVPVGPGKNIDQFISFGGGLGIKLRIVLD